MAKNKYYVALKRYLVEVDVGTRKLDLYQLSRRVSQARQHSVPSLDICELLEEYSSETKIPDTKIRTTYPIRKIPFVPNAVRGMPFTIHPVRR